MTPPRLARGAVVAGVLAATVLLGAAPAGADPARPTDYRSEVLAVDGELPAGAEVRVVGGDAFLELTIPEGHTAEVPDTATGGDGEPAPYLRFAADGTVERNESSFSAAANETRYGTAGRDFDPDAPVRWEEVASGGSYVWHDHRIHWMAGSAPTGLDDRGRVDLGGPDGTWEVPLVVDGEPVTVRGELLLLASPNPAPWIALVAVVALGAIGLGLLTKRAGRTLPYRALAAGAAAVGVAASVTGWAAWRDIPAAAGGNALPFVVPVVALVAAVAAALCPPRARLAALGATTAALGGWGVLRWEVLTHAVLPTGLPFVVDRAATALAIGTGLALAILLVWQPPLRPRRRSTTAPRRPAPVPSGPTASPTA